MTAPPLSIVIPTKNRRSTALAAISGIADIVGVEQLQVIVHDCSDDTSLHTMLQERGLDRLVEYHHTPDPIPMTENWNRAMAYVRGEYVIFIGDDDAIFPEILTVCRWAQENGFDAVKSKRNSTYWHPDFPSEAFAAKLRLEPFTGAVEVRETASVIASVVSTGDRYWEFPMVYYGLIRTAVMQRLYERSGRYFDGLSPDIYSAIAVGATIDRFAEVDYPLAIPGSSGTANSGRIVTGQLRKHYAEFGAYDFSWLAPESWIFEASNTDNVVKALEAAGRTDLIKHIQLTRVYARTIVKEPRRALMHMAKYVRTLRRLKRSVPLGLIALLLFIGGKAAALALKRRTSPHGVFVSNVESLRQAIAVQRDWLTAHGVEPPIGRTI